MNETRKARDVPEITVKLTVEEAYALRDFVVRANDRDIETILGETHRHAREASEAPSE